LFEGDHGGLSDQGNRDPANLDVEDPSLGAVLDFLRLLWAVDHVEAAVRRALARLPETVAETSRLLGVVAEELASAE
jgi:hypothetical protein